MIDVKSNIKIAFVGAKLDGINGWILNQFMFIRLLIIERFIRSSPSGFR